jgi:hypothetical protein
MRNIVLQLPSIVKLLHDFIEELWLGFNLEMTCPLGIKGIYDECSKNSNC